MKLKSNRHIWAQVIGVLLTLLSLGFIGALIWSQSQSLPAFRPSGAQLLLLALACLAYAGSGLLLSRAWLGLMAWSGEQNVDPDQSRDIYAKAQLAKYIPGNVAQFFGRHVAGRKAGWSHTGLMLCTAFEILSLICVAGGIVFVGLVFTGVHTATIELPVLAVVLTGATVFGVLLLRGAPRFLSRRWPTLAARLADRRIVDLWGVASLHAAFFLAGGLILLLVTHLVLGRSVDIFYWPAIVSLFAAGWVAGAITPGPPSGLGIRETVIVLGLAAVAPVAEAAIVALLMRLLTVAGDVVFYFFSGHMANAGQKLIPRRPQGDTAG